MSSGMTLARIGTLLDDNGSHVVIIFEHDDDTPTKELTLSQDEARRYVTAWLAAAEAAAYESAIYLDLLDKGFPQDIMVVIFRRLRQRRDHVPDPAPGLALHTAIEDEGGTFVRISFEDQEPMYWDPEAARRHAMAVQLATHLAANENAYYEVLREVTPLDIDMMAALISHATERHADQLMRDKAPWLSTDPS